MHDHMKIVEKKDGEKVIFACNPRYGKGEIITYEPFDGIDVNYVDFHMNEPYTNIPEFDRTNTIEINYCLYGKYECEFKDQTVIYLCDGDFAVWSGKGDVVAADSSYKPYKGIAIRVNVERAASFIGQILKDKQIDLSICIHKTLSGKTSIIAKPGAKIQHIFDELYDLPSRYALDYIRIKVAELLLLVYSGGFTYEESGIKQYPRKYVQSAKDTRAYIEEHFSEHMTITSLAKQNCINASQLMECFKYIYGMTITDFLLHTRMAKASELLLKADIKVADISLLVGYANPSKFAEAFKRVYGATPIKYRNDNAPKIKMVSEYF